MPDFVDPPRCVLVVVAPVLRTLAFALLALTALVLVVGTVVTASGPHSGDPAAARTGLDAGAVSQLHADLVMLLIGATVGLWAALRATGAPAGAQRAAGVLLLVELAQGFIGFAQTFTDLPVLLVGVHLAGACATLVCAVRLVLATRDRGPLALGTSAPRAKELQPA